MAGILHTAAGASVDERSDGAWHAEWATLRTLARRTVVAAVAHLGTRHGSAGATPTRAAANLAAAQGLLSEQRAMTELTGRAALPDYTGATDRLIDADAGPGPPLLQGHTMSIPRLPVIDFGGPDDGPCSCSAPLWARRRPPCGAGVAQRLNDHLRVVGWDLPGHGRGVQAQPFTIADLAAAVLLLADSLGADTFHYAGDSVGGCVGLQLLLDAPQRVGSATLLCTGAAIGTPDDWLERAATVRAGGIDTMLAGAAQRWFAPGFVDRQPGVGAALLDALSHTDPESYAQVCEALAVFDVTDRLSEIAIPVLAVAGSADGATPPESLRCIASGVQDGDLVVLDGVGHLAPVEAPDRVARPHRRARRCTAAPE